MDKSVHIEIVDHIPTDLEKAALVRAKKNASLADNYLRSAARRDRCCTAFWCFALCCFFGGGIVLVLIGSSQIPNVDIDSMFPLWGAITIGVVVMVILCPCAVIWWFIWRLTERYA